MLSPTDREKVIATIQSSFPSDNKWVMLREKHENTSNTTSIAICAALTVACVPTFIWCLNMAFFASNVSIGMGSWCLMGALASALAFFTLLGGSFFEAVERRKIAKWFKDPETKNHLRLLFKEKHGKRYIQKMLPKMSDQEIELLDKYPNAKSLFKNLIAKEKSKRQKANQDQQAKEIEKSFVLSVENGEGADPENVIIVEAPKFGSLKL